MTAPWRTTDLSTTPPMIQVGQDDRRTITYDAGEAISDATVTMRQLGPLTDVTATTVETVVVGASSVSVTLAGAGWSRGERYELSVVTVFAADSEQQTSTTVFECVA